MLVQFVAISTLLFVLTSPVFAVDKVIIEHDPDNPLFLKDPILAGMLSVLVPGAGQLYNEENTKAAAFFSVAVAGLSIAFDLFDDRRDRDTEDFFWIPSEQLSKRQLGGLLILFSSIASTAEAHMSAKKINAQRLRKLQLNTISSESQLGLRLDYRF